MIINTQSPTGGVFITNIAPTISGTVANKSYEDSVVLSACESDTTNVTVSILAMTGSSHLKPVVTVDGFAVINLTLDSDKRWAGSVAITGAGTTITALHEDGGSYRTAMVAAVGPVCTAFALSGGYPGTQTELKSGDTFNIVFSADIACAAYEVSTFEAAISSTGIISGTGSFTKSVTINNLGSGTFTNQRVKIRLQGTNGIWGAYSLSDVFGSGDGSAYVQLNNDVPVISSIAQGNIDYPASQSALKDSETATINHTITCPTGSFGVVYSSPGELTPTSATTYEPAKVVTRASGTYNIATTNLTITATKTTNAKVATRNVVVYIAHTAHTIAITQPNTRLRSSAAGADYTITITASQRLIEAPSLDALGAGEGTWQGVGFAGSNTVWTRTMRVADTDSKGTFNYAGAVSTNLAGKVVNTINSGGSYILGGFTFRTLTVAAWPNRETAIGTAVSNTAKLQCTNLSKGESGTLNDTFVANTIDAVDKFTITSPSTVYNATGNIWYNNDLSNAISNSSGTAQIELEEIV